MQMLPTTIVPDGANLLFGYSEATRQRPSSSPASGRVSDSGYLFVRKLHASVIFASLVCVSSLYLSVGNVIGLSPEKQMSRIYAGPIVTYMTYASPMMSDSYWNFTVGKFPSNTVSTNRTTHEPEVSVSSASYCAVPVPTVSISGYVDFAPETRGCIGVRISVSHKTSLGSIGQGSFERDSHSTPSLILHQVTT